MAAVLALLALGLGAARGGEAPPAERPLPAEGGQAPPAGKAEPAPAPAPEKTDTGYLKYEETGPPETPSMASVVARVLGSLAVVVGLIFVTGLGLRRYLGGVKAPTTSRKVSEVVEVTPLGGKRHLYLIRVADRLLVVGAGGDHLALLSEIRDPAVVEAVAAMPRRSDFFEMFHRLRAGAAKDAGQAEQGVAG